MQTLGAAVRRIRLAAAPALLGATGLVAIGIGPAVAQPPNDEVFTAKTAISLPSGEKVTSFDIGFVNAGLGLYFLADRTNNAVDVVETTTNTVFQRGVGQFAGVGASPDTSGPNGLLTVGPNRVWIGDYPSRVKVLDPNTDTIIKTISTGGSFRADELCYDSADKQVLIANDAEHDNPANWPFVTFISTTDYSILGKITMDGTKGTPLATNGIEQCQWSKSTGMFYLAIPEVNGPGDDSKPGAVLEISPHTMKIVRTFTIPIGVCAGPQGMALGPEDQILLGCNNPAPHHVPSTVIISAHSGHVIHVLANEDGSDEVWYNPADGHYFLARSGGAGTAQHLGVVDAQTGREDTSSVTGVIGTGHGGAHSVAADKLTKHVFVPIPSTAGGMVCSSATETPGSDKLGCIAVYSTLKDDEHHHDDDHID